MRFLSSFPVVVATLALAAGCGSSVCEENPDVCGTGGATATSSTGSPSSSASKSTVSGSGTGGALPCGGCSGALPFCDEGKNMCVACLSDANCDSASAAHCDDGACVACTASTECTHLAGTTVCDTGTCVECALGDESACGGASTCDLVLKTCTGPASGSVQNCNFCTNDVQCVSGHRCIPMDFDGTFHGQYCLKDAAGGCSKPFLTAINKPSISGQAAVNYCGVDQNVVTCEAVEALLDGWQCPSGTDGMCSPDGVAPEQATPGALCRDVGVGMNLCTYECGGANDCLPSGSGATCGGTSPTYCGG